LSVNKHQNKLFLEIGLGVLLNWVKRNFSS
jgi:hypothetical protein